MCNIWKYPTDIAHEIKPEVAALMPGGLRRINLTGGEPMLRDDIEEIVGILYKKCHVLEISTNGYYTDKLVSIAEKFPRVMIRISLEGLPALNDKLRGTRNGFDHALRSMLELKKTKATNIGFSVVICDKNVTDLVNLYDLAVGLDVEFAQSTMHNSWYFHKDDNEVNDKEIVLEEMRRFMASLLSSKRRSMKLRVKDWLRAFFNLRLYNYIKTGVSKQNVCTAGSDLFFVDPYGNVTPCNGSDEEWIMGNLKDNTFEQIWNSARAQEIRQNVNACTKDCAFIGTARFAMLMNPWEPIGWIAKNKIRIWQGRALDFESETGSPASDGITDLPVINRNTPKLNNTVNSGRKLIIK
jgi:MoaA/NifB/PqqE/SkfB family radical SAM enzyme